MRKLNQNGFAIASILYSIMVLFLMLLLSILGILGSRKAILDKNKKDIMTELNQNNLYNRFIFEHKNITIINNGNISDINYALMDGVRAFDENGNEITKENISYDLDINNITNNEYRVNYVATTSGKNITDTRLVIFTPITSIMTYDYTGEEQVFTSNYSGSYRVELWGAQGGGVYGGNGAYTTGIIKFIKNKKEYIFVGGNPTTTLEYGYNGGGISNSDGRFGSGGGATDIRNIGGTWNDFNSLKSRIMVAAGGGGGCVNCGVAGTILSGGIGGKLNGGDGKIAQIPADSDEFVSIATGATQTSGGNRGTGTRTDLSCASNGSFGIGGNGGSCCIAAGGSGYYGGAGSGVANSTGGTGSGGSSFISGYDGCDAIAENSTEDNIIHTGQSVHYSGYKFNNAVMYAGDEEIPTHTGDSTMVGNSGNGFAKISLIYYWED